MTAKFQRDRVAAALLHSWSLETSGKWLASNPARGQCNVTALLINELFGGEILKTPQPEGDHFYNRVDGQRIDLTESQFEAPIAYADLQSTREEALAGTSMEKYEALKRAYRRRFAWSPHERAQEPSRRLHEMQAVAHTGLQMAFRAPQR